MRSLIVIFDSHPVPPPISSVPVAEAREYRSFFRPFEAGSFEDDFRPVSHWQEHLDPSMAKSYPKHLQTCLFSFSL